MNTDQKDPLVPFYNCKDCKSSIKQDPEYKEMPQLVCTDEVAKKYWRVQSSVGYCNNMNKKGWCPEFKKKGLLRRLLGT